MFSTATRRMVQTINPPVSTLKSRSLLTTTTTLITRTQQRQFSCNTSSQIPQRKFVKSPTTLTPPRRTTLNHINLAQKRSFSTQQTTTPQQSIPSPATPQTTTVAPTTGVEGAINVTKQEATTTAVPVEVTIPTPSQSNPFTSANFVTPAIHRTRLATFERGEWPREANSQYWADLLPPRNEVDMKNFELRYPGMLQRVTKLVELDSYSKVRDFKGDKVREEMYTEMLKQNAVMREKLIAELKFPEIDVVTGAGLTPLEQNKLFVDAVASANIKTTATMRVSRDDFYQDSKKAGLYKNTLFNRLFNSKEDMLLARPAKKEWAAHEQAAVQPRSWLGLAAVSLCTFAGVLYIKYLDTQTVAAATVVQYQTSGTLDIGGDFDELIDQFGKEANSKQYRGFYPLYYFGFTKCPDICPTELHKMMAALDTIERNQPDLYRYIKPVFISVDPLRDTPEQIKAYAENFHPRMRWLTGSHEALTRAAKEFHIYFSIPDDATPDGDYNVDHSIFFFLMNRDGKLLSYYGQNKNSQEIATAMASVVKEDLDRDQYENAINKKKDGGKM